MRLKTASPEIMELMMRNYERARDLYIEWTRLGRKANEQFLSIEDVEANYLGWCRELAQHGVALT